MKYSCRWYYVFLWMIKQADDIGGSTYHFDSFGLSALSSTAVPRFVAVLLICDIDNTLR